jgi:hypothetical protein
MIPQAKENEQIHEMHEAQRKDDDTQFANEKLHEFSLVYHVAVFSHGETDIANVNQVKADQKQVVDRLG